MTTTPAHLCTTFAKLHDANACPTGYAKLAKHIRDQFAVTPQDYGMTRPIPLALVLESNGLADGLWVARNALCGEQADRDRFLRLLACDFAEHVLHIFEKKYPTDNRPRNAIRVARAFANGEATATELIEARRAAAAAAYAADAYAADAAAYAAADAAAYAADAAADAAAYAYAYAYAYAAAADAAAAAAAARATEKQWQLDRFKEAIATEVSRFAATFSEGSEAGSEVAA